MPHGLRKNDSLARFRLDRTYWCILGLSREYFPPQELLFPSCRKQRYRFVEESGLTALESLNPVAVVEIRRTVPAVHIRVTTPHTLTYWNSRAARTSTPLR